MKEWEFLARVEALGEMEVVVPIRGHRLTWTGSGEVAVAGSLNPELPHLVAHEPSGFRTRLEYSGLQRYDAFFLIRPRETFGTRIGRQPDVPGSVIQDPDDGEHAIIATWKVEGQDPVSVDYGRFDNEEALRAHLETYASKVSLRCAGTFLVRLYCLFPRRPMALCSTRAQSRPTGSSMMILAMRHSAIPQVALTWIFRGSPLPSVGRSRP